MTNVFPSTYSSGLKCVAQSRSTPVQSQKAVSAYFTGEQILPYGFAEQSMTQDACHLLQYYTNSCYSKKIHRTLRKYK